MAGFDAPTSGPLRVAVLAGGESDERDVSLKSGRSVVRALSARGHAATQIDPANVDLKHATWDRFDAVFIALHGRYGEDGTVQAILEYADVPFTGSDSTASRLAFSKSASKERFLQCDVPTPPYVLIHESDDAARIQTHARKIAFPLVVKPDAQGSSLGVSIVDSPDKLPQALARCFHYDAFGILEPAIIGTEWTVGLLDDQMLPLVQIETARQFYDYQAKYEDGATAYWFEFPLPTNVIARIQDAGRRAAAALRTRGLVRVDIRLDRFHQPWVLEVNTVPGLTDHSLVPKAAARMGVDLGELCEKALHTCLKAHAGRQHHPFY